ncbi:tol-pal system-associated acyl-CoA thioesterase [Endozoicomonas sp. SM1973]|uniref:Tol-pal system-associated acyl-CoA thioesterase n=1 Tax=Spartinivicinus marinus TaxID=2994442 RepID=A0A853IK28_9GAMM|nr:tol-pal system-associated acyl-CoA thioesterase [Spartinivicinus marinus]NYZ68006.1 tol-pal system-associated acyl-CoA thioesterase [Spartinivicinus marinus]
MDNFAIRCRVYFEDTDAGGIVYYVNYLKYMERARTDLLRSLGIEQHSLLEQNVMFVVHSSSINYRSPARLDDELKVTATVKKLTKVAIIFIQQVVNCRTNVLCCEAEVKVACVSSNNMRPTMIPTSLQQKIQLL